YVPDKPSAAFTFAASTGCASQKVNFTDHSIPNCNEIKSRLWNFGDPASGTADTSSQANPVHTFSSAGTYTVKLVVFNCTLGKDSLSQTLTVSAGTGQTVTLTAQSNPLCSGSSNGSATVNVSGGVLPYTYSWSPSGGNTSTATGLAGGTYTCTVTDAGGCLQTQVLTLTNPPALVQTLSSAPVCGPHAGSATSVSSGGTGTLAYSWSPGGGTNALATSLTSGIYTCTVTDASGCSIATTVTVKADSIPLANSGTNVLISIGSSTLLNASGGGTYSWSPATGLSCTACANPDASPLVTTEYCVRVSNSAGCTDSSCVLITVDNTCGDVYVPNYFSPNGDGENDRLCVYGNCIRTMTFAVYDRWGENVFTATSPGACWDGMYKGQKMNTAVFAWYLQANLLNGITVTQKGTVNLVR
ncbi:MAG TPA: gliding motility-associated C-terminal domain-containing protein, partial [Bacteroidia bacterium]|nr:gliding motility-associated C-terminal domain-containing protein [Bacteroidia bacterium]